MLLRFITQFHFHTITSLLLSLSISHRCWVGSFGTMFSFALVRQNEYLILEWEAISGGITTRYWISATNMISSLVMWGYPLKWWHASHHNTNETYITYGTYLISFSKYVFWSVWIMLETFQFYFKNPLIVAQLQQFRVKYAAFILLETRASQLSTCPASILEKIVDC